MPKKRKKRNRPLGIYVYCTEEEKERIDRARRFTRRTLSGYMLEAALRQVEADELEMAKRKRPI